MERPEEYLQNSTSFDEHAVPSQLESSTNNFSEQTKNENIIKKESSSSSTIQKVYRED